MGQVFGQRKMCVQVVKGRTRDPAGMRAAAERWYRQVAPRARGWLGTTGGVTEEGVYICLTRFASQKAAHRNDERREQVEWWERTRDLFEGEISVAESTDVEMFGRGGADQAGFVQVLQTHVRDREAVRPFLPEEAERTLMQLRPDMIGVMLCVHPDGVCTGVAYFTSREAAREGERTKMPPDYKAWRDQQMAHFSQEAVFYDLDVFWLQSP